MHDVSEFEKAAFSQRLLVVSELVRELFEHPVDDLIDLRVDLVATHEYFVCSRWRNLDLSAQRAVQFVPFMLLIRLPTGNVRITFRTIFDLVQTLFLAVETLELDHVERVY